MLRLISIMAIALLQLILFTPALQAQPFTHDPSFQITGFNFNDPVSKNIYRSLELPDGKLIMHGAIRDITDYRGGMIRTSDNGQLDPSFILDNSLATSDERVNMVVPQPYGYWINYGIGETAKISPNGQELDIAYRHNHINDVGLCSYTEPVIFSDGSLLVGSRSSPCKYYGNGLPGTDPRFLKRFWPNGHLDTTFFNGPDGSLTSIMRYGSDRILLGGRFWNYNSTPIYSLCRIDTLGNLDTTFQSIINTGYVHPMHVQADGKIIIGGVFTLQNHPDTLGMARLNSDGSLDSTFNNFSNINPYVDGGGISFGFINDICPTTEGGYLIGGLFIRFQGTTKGHIVKTDANGFLEPQYFTGTGFDSAPSTVVNSPPYVTSIMRSSNDYYYVTGYFNGYDGQPTQPVLRLRGFTTATGPELRQPLFTAYPNPATGKVVVELTEAATTGENRLQLHNLLGRQVLWQRFTGTSLSIDLEAVPAGLYLLTLTNAQGQRWQQKLVVQP